MIIILKFSQTKPGTSSCLTTQNVIFYPPSIVAEALLPSYNPSNMWQSWFSVPEVHRARGLRVHYPKPVSKAVRCPKPQSSPSWKYTMATLTTIPHTSRSSFLPYRSQCSRFILTADLSIASKSGRPLQTLISSRYSPLRRLSAAAQPVFSTSPALVSSVDDLFEFICSGPLLQRMGFTTESVADGIDKWLLCGGYLCRLFGMNELRLTVPEKARVYHFYVPVFFWCEQQIERHALSFGDAEEVAPPLVVCGTFYYRIVFIHLVSCLFWMKVLCVSEIFGEALRMGGINYGMNGLDLWLTTARVSFD